MEDLQLYLDEMVQPTLEDFEAKPTSRRHAFLACVVIAHAVDYLEHPRRPNQRRNELKDQSKDFRLVDQIAHAFKQVRSSLKQSQVIVRPPAYCGMAVCGLSYCGDETGGVTVDDRVEIDLLGTAKKAVALLREISRPSGAK
jgi:hypothetical protein